MINELDCWFDLQLLSVIHPDVQVRVYFRSQYESIKDYPEAAGTTQTRAHYNYSISEQPQIIKTNITVDLNKADVNYYTEVIYHEAAHAAVNILSQLEYTMDDIADKHNELLPFLIGEIANVILSPEGYAPPVITLEGYQMKEENNG